MMYGDLITIKDLYCPVWECYFSGPQPIVKFTIRATSSAKVCSLVKVPGSSMFSRVVTKDPHQPIIVATRATYCQNWSFQQSHCLFH